MIEKLLFFTSAPLVESLGARLGALVVDWERAEKRTRQRGRDTQISVHTAADLAAARRASPLRLICRVNGIGPASAPEFEAAIAGGADELLIPMVTSVAQVERALALAAGRVPVGILIETDAAVRLAPELARFPLARVFVGLNDLAIDRGSPSIFTAVADGTVESLRRAFDAPFGFGGLTDPEGGEPIPCSLLLAEMVRLDCQFTFLRRSFYAAIARRDPRDVLDRLAAAERRARQRDAGAVRADAEALRRRISAVELAPSP